MKVIALTGSFGTGKSTVDSLFLKQGVPYLDSDIIAHELTQPHSAAWTEIVNTWGNKILTKDLNIDRQKLSKIVFSSDSDRKTLESILHPKIMNILQKKIEEHRKQKTPLLIVDIPLIFEIGWHETDWFDYILLVSSKSKQQMARLIKTGHWNEKDIKQRLKVQWPLEQKKALADFVIDNSGSIQETEQQVCAILERLKGN